MNSQQSVLQVKQLSLTGEVLNTVNCFSGQVSVLRAAADDMLMPYRNALSGLGGGGKFSVLLNGEEFKPEDKHLIGFGGDVVLEGTVGSLVEQAGIPVAQLASFGLDEFVERDFQDLRSCPRRRIALLLKLFSREKVLIMDNPFEPISSRWKERFAEAVISSVEDTQSIYVVPRLSYRPQCWVGNRVIARIEVGKSIQKTIGFGTTSDDTNTMVQQVRDLVKDEALVEQILANQGVRSSEPTAPPPPESDADHVAASLTGSSAQSGGGAVPTNSAIPDVLQHVRHYVTPREIGLMVGGFLLVMLCYAVYRISDDDIDTSSSTDIQKVETVSLSAAGQRDDSQRKVNGSLSKDDRRHVKANVDPGQEVVNPPSQAVTFAKLIQRNARGKAARGNDRPARPLPEDFRRAMAMGQKILDPYPAHIQQAVSDAFEGKVIYQAALQELRPFDVGEVDQVESSSTQGDNPFASLMSLPSEPGSADDAGSAPPPNPFAAMAGQSNSERRTLPFDLSGGSEETEEQRIQREERREMIRQKFLEAIQRAADQRQAQEEF